MLLKFKAETYMTLKSSLNIFLIHFKAVTLQIFFLQVAIICFVNNNNNFIYFMQRTVKLRIKKEIKSKTKQLQQIPSVKRNP